MKRAREIAKMVENEGLELIGKITLTGGNHLKAVCRNPAGYQRFFTFALTPSDHRGDMQDKSQLRRFARATVITQRNATC